ncbi:CDP-glucose 4,6-dehydratase [Planctomycetota bacterium]
MEKLVMDELFGQIYKNRKVLITGHTGFKGSWLALWLSRMGAEVVGYALEACTCPSHFELVDANYKSIIGDIRDADKFRNVIAKEQPEIIFHLAAQPLVRRSYQDPVETFSTNVMGTVNLLDSCREVSSLKAVVVITSDKCYENLEQQRGYSESDPLGGYDPYSASKGCTEIVTSSYRRSFFSLKDYGTKHNVLVSSARAGNVIGGGDWSEDRLIPDIVKAANENDKVLIRNRYSTRPWQHVLDPLSGYLLLGEKLLEGKVEFAEAWNFGPEMEVSFTVEYVVENLQKYWDKIEVDFGSESSGPHEANLLTLDCSKAIQKLGWKPVWDISRTLEMTASWYKRFYELGEVVSSQQLSEYVKDALGGKL